MPEEILARARRAKHPLRSTYDNMIRRCYSPRATSYHRYGGRGITVCDEWRKDFRSFLDWVSTHPKLPGTTLDRENNALGYGPDNCRWATRKQQGENRDGLLLITAFGETKHSYDWSNDPRCRVTITGILHRLRRGLSPEDAITAEPIPHHRRAFRKPKLTDEQAISIYHRLVGGEPGTKICKEFNMTKHSLYKITLGKA